MADGMAREDRRGSTGSALFIVALCASFAVVLAILFSWVKSDRTGYELTGSTSKKAPSSFSPD
jgi:hypothetical protein